MHEYMKYIIVENMGRETAILFHYLMQHDFLGFSFDRIVSAGFCYITKEGNVRVFGKSDSLNKESREDKDPEIIRETITPKKAFDDFPKFPTNIFDKKDE